MADEGLLNKIQDLSDLELATLLCLTNREHCIIDTDPSALDETVSELKLIASRVFGLSYTVVECSEYTSLDDFADSIFTEADSPTRSESPIRTRQDSLFLQSPAFRSLSRSPMSDTFSDNKKIANVIIAKDLDEAPIQVQIQALELMRTGYIYTRTSVQTAPKRFLFIALIAGGEGPRLTKHLNDYMFISHFHDPEDGFPNLEDLETDGDSISSVVRKNTIDHLIEAASDPLFSASDVETLEQASSKVEVSVEIMRYLQNIISFLRLHRAVSSGISPGATQQFDKLVRSLAPLHGLTYVTPSLVGLAAKKIYPHRIHIVEPRNERSMQWGSDLDAVAAALEEIGPEEVIDDVLGMVEVPL